MQISAVLLLSTVIVVKIFQVETLENVTSHLEDLFWILIAVGWKIITTKQLKLEIPTVDDWIDEERCKEWPLLLDCNNTGF